MSMLKCFRVLGLVAVFLLLGAGCNTPKDEPQKTGNLVCEDTFYITKLNEFSATSFTTEPFSSANTVPYRANNACEYLGYIQEDNVDNFSEVGIIEDPQKELFSNMLTGAKANERWIKDDKTPAGTESFFTQTFPLSLSSTLPTWSLYVYKNGAIYAVKNIIQNNKHTDGETKTFLRELSEHLMQN